jgi:hypothetical protein
MKINIRYRVGVNYSGRTLNVPKSYTTEQIKAFCTKWIKENSPESIDHFYWKIYTK